MDQHLPAHRIDRRIVLGQPVFQILQRLLKTGAGSDRRDTVGPERVFHAALVPDEFVIDALLGQRIDQQRGRFRTGIVLQILLHRRDAFPQAAAGQNAGGAELGAVILLQIVQQIFGCLLMNRLRIALGVADILADPFQSRLRIPGT